MNAQESSFSNSVQLTGLDDRNFNELIKEGIELLPIYAPKWTNHNPSDPGITLLELFAYFTDILLFRLGQVSSESKLQFLRLLTAMDINGEVWKSIEHAGVEHIHDALISAARELQNIDSAVTVSDFERLALEAVSIEQENDEFIRVMCVPNYDLEHSDFTQCKKSVNHVSVIIAPRRCLEAEKHEMLLTKVRNYLKPRCLLTTSLHVVAPKYLYITVRASITTQTGADKDEVECSVRTNVQRYFGSGIGEGPHAQGWPFGRPFYLSEAIALIDRIDGVDYVNQIEVMHLSNDMEMYETKHTSVGIRTGVHSSIGKDTYLGAAMELGNPRLARNEMGELDAVLLNPWELLHVNVLTLIVNDVRKTKLRGQYE